MGRECGGRLDITVCCADLALLRASGLRLGATSARSVLSTPETMQLQCVITSDVSQAKVIRIAQQAGCRKEVQQKPLWLVRIFGSPSDDHENTPAVLKNADVWINSGTC